MKASMPVKKSVPMVQKTFTIEKDVLPGALEMAA